MEETYSGARPDTNQTLSNQNVFDINHQMIHVIYTSKVRISIFTD